MFKLAVAVAVIVVAVLAVGLIGFTLIADALNNWSDME